MYNRYVCQISYVTVVHKVWSVGSQGIHDQFPGDPWIHFSNHYFKVYLFFKLKE